MVLIIAESLPIRLSLQLVIEQLGREIRQDASQTLYFLKSTNVMGLTSATARNWEEGRVKTGALLYLLIRHSGLGHVLLQLLELLLGESGPRHRSSQLPLELQLCREGEVFYLLPGDAATSRMVMVILTTMAMRAHL
jgi:hypothetical protein